MANDLRTKLADTLEKQYLAALDAASVGQDILPFANFIREEMNVDWSREPARG